MDSYRNQMIEFYVTLRQRLSREDGQGGVEYLGVVIAAALLVLVIVGAASGLGEKITGGISDKIDEVLDGGDGGSGPFGLF